MVDQNEIFWMIKYVWKWILALEPNFHGDWCKNGHATRKKSENTLKSQQALGQLFQKEVKNTCHDAMNSSWDQTSELQNKWVQSELVEVCWPESEKDTEKIYWKNTERTDWRIQRRQIEKYGEDRWKIRRGQISPQASSSNWWLVAILACYRAAASFSKLFPT